MMSVKRAYGWVRDLYDPRDMKYPFKAKAPSKLPATAMLKGPTIGIYNQGNVGSCTAQSGRFLYQFSLGEEGKPNPLLSAHQLYYCSRMDMGTVNQDSGATIRGMMKAMCTNYGICDEKTWPDSKNFKTKPSATALTEARKRRLPTKNYVRVERTVNALKTAIVNNNPVVFGFPVYSNFSAAGRTGVMPRPAGSQEGGHAVVIVGYAEKGFLCRNSWGNRWGVAGHFWMSEELMIEFGRDFWTLVDV